MSLSGGLKKPYSITTRPEAPETPDCFSSDDATPEWAKKTAEIHLQN